MADTEIIRKRLEQHILNSAHTFREVSLHIGRKDSYIQQYVKYGFPKRLSEIDRKKVCRFLNIDEKELIDDELINQFVREPLITNPKACLGKSCDYVMIDIYSPRPKIDFFNTVVGRISLNQKEFGSWCGANPENLRAIRIDGDYMEPTFPNGSLVLYDTTSTTFKTDGLYVIMHNGIAQLKRVQQVYTDMYILMDDNPHYENVEREFLHLEILGRAVTCLSAHPL